MGMWPAGSEARALEVPPAWPSLVAYFPMMEPAAGVPSRAACRVAIVATGFVFAAASFAAIVMPCRLM